MHSLFLVHFVNFYMFRPYLGPSSGGRGQLKCDGTRAETNFRLSAKQTSPFKTAVASVQSTTGSRGVCISGSNAGYTMFRGSVKSTGYPLHSPVSFHFPSRASPCAITFQLDSTTVCIQQLVLKFFLDDCLLPRLDWESNQDNRQSSKENLSTNCCIHTVVPPDDGPRYGRNM
jgi:hypothetical protein